VKLSDATSARNMVKVRQFLHVRGVDVHSTWFKTGPDTTNKHARVFQKTSIYCLDLFVVRGAQKNTQLDVTRFKGSVSTILDGFSEYNIGHTPCCNATVCDNYFEHKSMS
jgi:hypothetical protein